MKRSPWFNAIRQPPVNGGPDAMYEWRCIKSALKHYDFEKAIGIWTISDINDCVCPTCEWRGILREHDGPGGVVTGGGM